jgi:hypothetical protein
MGIGSVSRGYSGRAVALNTRLPSSADVKETVELSTFPLNLHGLFYGEYYHNITTILQQYYHNITTILPQYYHNITTILQQYYHNITTILPQYYHNITTILPQYYHKI